MNSPSGVKASGPLIRRTISALPIAGTRRTAPSISGAKRSQSGGRSRWLKSPGSLEPPRRGFALVAAGDQTADLLAEVDQVVRVPQHRDRGVDPVDGLRDEILVRHRDEGDRHAHHPPDLRRVDPARVHDDVGADGPLGGLDVVDAAVPHADAEDPGARADLGPALARAVGQRHREAARVEVPVGGEIHGPEHAVGRHHREEPPRLVRSHLLEREPERLGPPLLAPVLQEAVGRAREPEAARLLPAGVAAGLGGEPPVALDAPHHEARERDGRTELADQPRGVEGRAAGELGTLPTSTMSRQPLAVRWYAMLAPPTPPPMITARACSVTAPDCNRGAGP